LGDKAVGEIDVTKTAIEDLSGAINGLDTGDFQTQFISALRTVQIEFGDLTVWDQAKGKIIAVFSDIAANLGPALENADFSGLEDKVGELWDTIADIFSSNDLDLTTAEGMDDAVQMIVDSLESLASVTTGIIDILSPAVDAVIAIVDGFNDLDPDMQELAGNVAAVGAAFGVLGGIVSAGGALIGGLSSLVGFVGTGGSLISGLSIAALNTSSFGQAVNSLTGTAGGAGLLALSGALGYQVGTLINEYVPGVKEGTQAMIGWADSLFDFTGKQEAAANEAASFDKMVDSLIASTQSFRYDLSDLGQELQGLGHDIDGLPDDAIIKLAAEADILSAEDAMKLIRDRVEKDSLATTVTADAQPALDGLDSLKTAIDDIPSEKTTDISADIDQQTIDDAKEELIWFDENDVQHSILVDADTSAVDQVKKDIDGIPNKKLLEIQLQGDIDTQIAAIEAQAATAQAAFQYTAEVDIAQAQAQADILTAAYDAAGQSVDAMAGATSDMFGALAGSMDDLSTLDKWDLQDRLDEQQEQQGEILKSQIALNEAQVKYTEAKTAAMERGDALIQIDSSGLEPALEMVMWQIIEKVQIRANEASADFLLGLS